MSRTMLHLSKQNLKFSAAHFLIFDEKRAERLHGHNYQVSLELEYQGAGDNGYFIDFSVIKKIVHDEVLKLDEYTLIPAKNPEMKVSEISQSTIQVLFRDRTYQFPKSEVLLMPLTNTSVEQLSQYLGQNLMTKLKPMGVCRLLVKVEETAGQGASYEAI